MPIVNSFCFVFDLRIGTVIILIFNLLTLGGSQLAIMDYLILALIYINYGYQIYQLVTFAYGVCAILGLYAAYKEDERFLLPVVIMQGILMLFLALCAFVLLLNYSGFIPETRTKLPGLIGSLVFSILLQGYFGVVMYSYYQQLTGQ